MRSSFIIAFLVVAISSSTFAVDNIFGVKIEPEKFYTLGKADVDKEIAAKTELLTQIEDFKQKVMPDDRAWIIDFMKLVTTEREIIEKLHVPLSHLNTDNVEHINDDGLRRQISDGLFDQLKNGLNQYLRMLKTFDFSSTVWEQRAFLGNPFSEFLKKVSAKPDNLRVTPLAKAFKDALAEVNKVKISINNIVTAFSKKLNLQKANSQIFMTELRNLNLMAIQNTDKKVSKSVKSLATKLSKLKSAIENVNKVPPLLQCFIAKRAWLDEIRVQLENLDKSHRTLNTNLSSIY